MREPNSRSWFGQALGRALLAFVLVVISPVFALIAGVSVWGLGRKQNPGWVQNGLVLSMLLAAVGTFAAFAQPLPTLWSVAHFLWAGMFTMMGASLIHLTHPGTALRQETCDAALTWVVVAWGMAVLALIFPGMLWALQINGPLWLKGAFVVYLLGWLGGASIVGESMIALQARFNENRPKQLRAALSRWLQWSRNLRLQSLPHGFVATGHIDGFEVLIEYDEKRIPPRLSFVIHGSSAIPASLMIKRKDAMRGRHPGQPLTDPLLQGALWVGGIEASLADELLGDAHEAVMPIFHGSEDAQLESQTLRYSVLVEPGMDLESLTARVDEGPALMRHLHSRFQEMGVEDVRRHGVGMRQRES
ncbi:MAG: hypothetical protein AAFV53_16170 [Myxococcota bacterium]